MTDDRAALAAFGGVARLFPLPNMTLFPHVVQGLHIFEPRYRQMTADALADDGLITLVLLKPGWENEYDAAPEVEAVGCLARIVGHERLPDGRYNLRVRGVGRVRLLDELPTDKLYRSARAVVVPDVSPTDVGRLSALRRMLAEAVLTRFEAGGPAHNHLKELFDGEMPLGQLCDALAYALPVPLELKQLLLDQPHVDARAEALAEALRSSDEPDADAPSVSTPTPDVARKFPPDFSSN